MAYDYQGGISGAAGTALTPTRKPGSIMNAIERIEKATSFIFDQGRNLQDLADRIVGARPTPVSSEKVGSPPVCELARLEAAAQMLEMAASFLQDETQRLQQL